jgi:hypothetical protein
MGNLALTADYIHSDGIDQFLTVNLNPGQRTTPTSTVIVRQHATLGAVIQDSFVPVVTDVFGDTPFETLPVTSVTTRVNDGRTKYDALQLSLDKRFSQGFQFKTSYTLSSGRGNTTGNGVPNAQFQTQAGLGLAENEGPTAFDRRHNFVVSGLYKVPYTRGLIVSSIVRYLSGQPFTIFNSTIDTNQNGINVDPLAPGTFTNSRTFPNGEILTFSVDNAGGINGARLPDFFSVDLRLAYKFKFTERVNAGFTFELFNLTNRVNYDEITVSGDESQRTIPATPTTPERPGIFLTPTTAKPARTMQLGFRVAF